MVDKLNWRIATMNLTWMATIACENDGDLSLQRNVPIKPRYLNK